MKKLTDWIKNHQLAAFFLISFAITWGLGFAYDAVLKHEQYLWLPVVFVATCGPGLAGIIISAIADSQPKQGPRSAFWVAFVAAWLVALLVFLANLRFIENTPLSVAFVIVIMVSVLPVSFVIASAYSRSPAVRRYLSSLVGLRGVWGWALLALVMFPALFLISYPTNILINRQPIPVHQLPEVSLSLIGLVVVKLLYQVFFFNATGEETGWRGFALPRLQARTSPLVAALVIGVVWAGWHFFGWQSEGRPGLTLEFWADIFLVHMLLSVLIVWICNRAKGSILVAGIAHAALNTVQAFVPNWGPLFVVLSVAALVVISLDRMWKKLPSDHPAVFRDPAVDC